MIKFWTYIKSYAKIAFIIFAAIIGFILFRKREQTFLDEIDTLRSRHRDEIKRINEDREKERAAHRQNEENLKRTLASIQKQYEDAQKELTAKKKEEIKSIIKNSGSDPEALAVQLSSIAGFTIVLPDPE